MMRGDLSPSSSSPTVTGARTTSTARCARRSRVATHMLWMASSAWSSPGTWWCGRRGGGGGGAGAGVRAAGLKVVGVRAARLKVVGLRAAGLKVVGVRAGAKGVAKAVMREEATRRARAHGRVWW